MKARLFLVSALAAVAVHVSADTLAEASISGVTIKLVDLDPGDGIPPGMTEFQPPYTSALIEGDPPVPKRVDEHEVVYDRGPFELTATATLTSLLSRIELDHGTSIGARASASMQLVFLLTPNTELQLTFEAIAIAIPDGPAQTIVAENTAQINQSGVLPPAGASFHSQTRETTEFSHTPVELVYRSAADTKVVHVLAYSRLYLYPFASPIPEASTHALLIGGLLTLAGLAGRRGLTSRSTKDAHADGERDPSLRSG